VQPRHLVLRLWLLTALPVCLSAADLTPGQFQKGDRWAVIGDSITHGRRYHSFIYLFYATRFPGRRFETHNCGISGDTAAGALRRLEWDILPHKPTVATIMLGMNDVGRGLYGKSKTGEAFEKRRRAALDRHVANMTKLAERLTAAGCRIIFLTPSIYDQTADLKRENNYGVNDALGLCGRRMAEIAPRFSASVADLHGPMTAINAAGQKDDPTFTIVGRDRVHPGDVGQSIMAYLFLKAQKVPATVAEIVIDADAGSTIGSSKCTVSNLRISATEVAFECTEKSLPFPVLGSARAALDLVPFMVEMNREMLTVKNLASGRYVITIDDVSVASASCEQLARGIDLAGNEKTPMYQQALHVMSVNETRHSITARRLRTFAAQHHFMGSKKGIDYDDYDGMKVALLEMLEMRKGHPIYGYFKGQADIYLKYKPQEAELRREMVAAMAEVWQHNQPQAHRFVVRKATPEMLAELSATIVDDFRTYTGWRQTGWTNVKPEIIAEDGVFKLRAPRSANKRDMLGLTRRVSIDLSEAKALRVRIRAEKGSHFGAELVIDGKLKRVANYLQTDGSWQSLSFPLEGRRATSLTLILAEPGANASWARDSALYEVDKVWVE